MAAAATVVATLLVAIVSVGLAATLSFRLAGRFVPRMVSFSIGVLLATAFLHLVPEAFESGASPRRLCAVMLAGLFGFFFLEKVALYRHSHHFEGDGHHHHHGHDAHEAGRGGVFVLVGSAVHNFSDGIVIAGAFLASPWVGLAATLSILAHEIPHKLGDFVVLLNAHVPKRRAVRYASISSSAIVVGGIVGLSFLERMGALDPVRAGRRRVQLRLHLAVGPRAADASHRHARPARARRHDAGGADRARRRGRRRPERLVGRLTERPRRGVKSR